MTTPMTRLAQIEAFEQLLSKYARLLRRAYPVSRGERDMARDAVVNAYATMVALAEKVPTP